MNVTQNTILWFGKYKGESVKDVIEKDFSYIDWASDKIPEFKLDDETYEIVSELMHDEEEMHDEEDWEDYYPDFY